MGNFLMCRMAEIYATEQEMHAASHMVNEMLHEVRGSGPELGVISFWGNSNKDDKKGAHEDKAEDGAKGEPEDGRGVAKRHISAEHAERIFASVRKNYGDELAQIMFKLQKSKDNSEKLDRDISEVKEQFVITQEIGGVVELKKYLEGVCELSRDLSIHFHNEHTEHFSNGILDVLKERSKAETEKAENARVVIGRIVGTYLDDLKIPRPEHVNEVKVLKEIEHGLFLKWKGLEEDGGTQPNRKQVAAIGNAKSAYNHIKGLLNYLQPSEADSGEHDSKNPRLIHSGDGAAHLHSGDESSHLHSGDGPRHRHQDKEDGLPPAPEDGEAPDGEPLRHFDPEREEEIDRNLSRVNIDDNGSVRGSERTVNSRNQKSSRGGTANLPSFRGGA